MGNYRLDLLMIVFEIEVKALSRSSKGMACSRPSDSGAQGKERCED